MNEKRVPQVNDRVKSKDAERCLGVVKEVHEEVIGTTGDIKDKALMVKVQWDNGTFSYFAPEALEILESKS